MYVCILSHYRELYSVDISVVKSGRLLKMLANDYINVAALNCTSHSVLFSFSVGDSGESEERLISLYFFVLSEMAGCLEIRARCNSCKGVLFSYHNLRLHNIFKKKNLIIFIRRLSFSPVLMASSVYIEETFGIYSQYAKVEKRKL